MMQFLSNLLQGKEAQKSASDFFLHTPEKQRRKMIKKAIANSNKEQQKILEEYRKKFGSLAK